MRLRPMMLLPFVLLGAGCSSAALAYAEARDGFDSITHFADGPDEPQQFAFAAEGRRWSWPMRTFLRGTGLDWMLARYLEVRPRPVPVENPSAFARENLATMGEHANGSLGNLADTGVRALWIVSNDPQPLDQIVAVDCLERVLAALQVDPLNIGPPTRAGDDEMRAIDADLRTLDELAPWRRIARPPTARERAEVESAMRRSTAVVHSSASVGRRLIRFLLRAAHDETDQRMRALYARGLTDTLAQECAWALMLRVQATRFDEVRTAALTAAVRLSGPRAVNWAVAVLGRFELSPATRRHLIRLCASLPQDAVDRQDPRGPSPVAFLYDQVKRRDLARQQGADRAFWSDEEDGVSALALEALALCLGRDIDHDPAWADTWWNSRVLEGGTR